MRRIISLYLLLVCAMALPVFSQNLVDEALGDSSVVAEVNDFVLPDSLLFLSIVDDIVTSDLPHYSTSVLFMPLVFEKHETIPLSSNEANRL